MTKVYKTRGGWRIGLANRTRVYEAHKADPSKTGKRIAEELGLHEMTVCRAMVMIKKGWKPEGETE